MVQASEVSDPFVIAGSEAVLGLGPTKQSSLKKKAGLLRFVRNDAS
jgi:hypothetical protein